MPQSQSYPNPPPLHLPSALITKNTSSAPPPPKSWPKNWQQTGHNLATHAEQSQAMAILYRTVSCDTGKATALTLDPQHSHVPTVSYHPPHGRTRCLLLCSLCLIAFPPSSQAKSCAFTSPKKRRFGERGQGCGLIYFFGFIFPWMRAATNICVELWNRIKLNQIGAKGFG
jgi:hypothetical protein